MEGIQKQVAQGAENAVSHNTLNTTLPNVKTLHFTSSNGVTGNSGGGITLDTENVPNPHVRNRVVGVKPIRTRNVEAASCRFASRRTCGPQSRWKRQDAASTFPPFLTCGFRNVENTCIDVDFDATMRPLPGWRNRQTHRTQNPAVAIP